MKNIILCMFIDKDGKIRQRPHYFKPNNVDFCISDYSLGDIKNSNKTLYLEFLNIKEELMCDTCWTVNELVRRCDGDIKIFAKLESFYNVMTEVQFAFSSESFGEDYDDMIDVSLFKETVKGFDKKMLPEANGIKFFKYLKKMVDNI
ncbi:MAG: hypothetical protein ACRDDY_04130 [Clostridium sp.]|uniref:hypothetical protein n=1 Tax=Clostridium sp. TaxID=1506 RepID=UPI003EE64421